MKLSAFALAAVSAFVATAANARITCNLTDQQGNALTYSFAHGWHGGTTEIVVKRNGAVVSNGGPTWNRTWDRPAHKLVLQQDGWSIVYDSDTGHDQAELFHGRNSVATGVCDPDYSIDSPQAPVEASAPQQPLPNPDAPVASSSGAAPGSLSTYLGM
jgi:hypothetical protein